MGVRWVMVWHQRGCMAGGQLRTVRAGIWRRRTQGPESLLLPEYQLLLRYQLRHCHLKLEEKAACDRYFQAFDCRWKHGLTKGWRVTVRQAVARALQAHRFRILAQSLTSRPPSLNMLQVALSPAFPSLRRHHDPASNTRPSTWPTRKRAAFSPLQVTSLRIIRPRAITRRTTTSCRRCVTTLRCLVFKCLAHPPLLSSRALQTSRSRKAKALLPLCRRRRRRHQPRSWTAAMGLLVYPPHKGWVRRGWRWRNAEPRSLPSLQPRVLSQSAPLNPKP